MSEITTNKKTKDRFKYFGDFHKAAFRILLIDDKVGSKEYGCKGIPIKKTGESCDKELPFCRDCTKTIDEKKECSKEYFDISEIGEAGLQIIQCDNNNNCRNKQCKLCTIKRLMDDSEKNDGKRQVFTGIGETIDYFYWRESEIECYYCPTVIKDFNDDNTIHFSKDPDKYYPQRINVYIDDKDRNGDKELNIECDFAPVINRKDPKVQIIGVRDVRTALLLLSKFKFDMVFCDYLLDYKDDNNGDRDYAKQLLSFLSHEYKNDIDALKKSGAQEDDSRIKRLKVLNQLRRDVLDNRGPLNKLWIMPITGFNQTFIQDLYRNQINLIDYMWNISNGADPITTPWQFLYHLNKFVELQLRSSVYTTKQLLRFLLYTCLDFCQTGDVKFHEFQSFMGAEYANFMRLYGNRLIIRRDAVAEDGDKGTDKSVFATYVWTHFYEEQKYREVIELNRLIRRFLHQAATMHNDRNGQQRLEETFGQLCFFIDTNQKVKDTIKIEDELKDTLGEELKKLRNKMDKLSLEKKKKHTENN